MKSMAKIIILLSFIFSGIFITANSTALVVQFMNLSQLTARADLIFQGRVTAVHARWDDTRTAIWTYVTFAVDELIKGDMTEHEITIRLPGGAIEADDIQMKVDGVPTFQLGEETLIFSSRDPENRNPIIGWHQGRFKIRYDKASGQKVISDTRANQLIPPTRSAASADTAASEIPLKKFVDEIVRIKNIPLPK